MPKRTGRTGEAIVAAIEDSLCRRIRIADERIRLARALEIFAKSRPEVLSVVPRGLEDLLSYRQLADDGLAAATLRGSSGAIILLAAANRIWRRPDLKRRLISIKRDARRIGRRVMLVTKRGLNRSNGMAASRDASPSRR